MLVSETSHHPVRHKQEELGQPIVDAMGRPVNKSVVLCRTGYAYFDDTGIEDRMVIEATHPITKVHSQISMSIDELRRLVNLAASEGIVAEQPT